MLIKSEDIILRKINLQDSSRTENQINLKRFSRWEWLNLNPSQKTIRTKVSLALKFRRNSRRTSVLQKSIRHKTLALGHKWTLLNKRYTVTNRWCFNLRTLRSEKRKTRKKRAFLMLLLSLICHLKTLWVVILSKICQHLKRLRMKDPCFCLDKAVLTLYNILTILKSHQRKS